MGSIVSLFTARPSASRFAVRFRSLVNSAIGGERMGSIVSLFAARSPGSRFATRSPASRFAVRIRFLVSRLGLRPLASRLGLWHLASRFGLQTLALRIGLQPIASRLLGFVFEGISNETSSFQYFCPCYINFCGSILHIGFVGLMMGYFSNVRFLVSCRTSIRWGVKELHLRKGITNAM